MAGHLTVAAQSLAMTGASSEWDSNDQQRQRLNAILSDQHSQQQRYPQQSFMPSQLSTSSGVAPGTWSAPMMPSQDWLDELMMETGSGPPVTFVHDSSPLDPQIDTMSQLLPQSSQLLRTPQNYPPVQSSYASLSAVQSDHDQIDTQLSASNLSASNFDLSPEVAQPQEHSNMCSTSSAAAMPSNMPVLGQSGEQLILSFFDPADFNDMYEQALVSLHQPPSSSLNSTTGSQQEDFMQTVPPNELQQLQEQQQAPDSLETSLSTQQLIDQLSHWYVPTSRTRQFEDASHAQHYQQQDSPQHTGESSADTDAKHAARYSDPVTAGATSSFVLNISCESAHPSGWVNGTGRSSSAENKTAQKRKVSDYEAPAQLPGARSVSHRTFSQRQQERKSSKAVIEVSPSCMGGCGKNNIAIILFHNSDSLLQIERDHAIRAFCEDCGLQRGLLRPSQPQAEPVAGAEGFEKNPAGATEHLGDGCKRCDLCKRRIGSVEILSPSTLHEVSSPTEVLCSTCDARYAFCTQCGGGNKYRTGKWRPKALFPPGRKTCRLRSIRLTGTPRIEVYDIGVTEEPIPDDVLDGCKVTFEDKFLFRFAKPMCEFVRVLRV